MPAVSRSNSSLIQGPVQWEPYCVLALLAIWVFILSVQIGPGLIAGLAVFSLARFVRRGFDKLVARHIERVHSKTAKWLIRRLPIGLTVLVVVSVATLITLGFGNAVRFVVATLIEQGPKLIDEAIANLTTVTAQLPESIRSQVPVNTEELFAMVRSSVGDGLTYVRSFGGAGFFIMLQLVFALILGLSAGLMRISHTPKPLTKAWTGTMERYVKCFTLLMGAQVYVSIWNTFCTAIFVYFILPVFDVVLPFRELLLMFTAVASLIPAAGNIMANTLILLLTIRYGPWVAMGSVTYLFIIHKVEYFVNGYIIGRNVRASVPEMLIAIIFGETAFGLPGLITAPVTYAFLKVHWQRWGWV